MPDHHPSPSDLPDNDHPERIIICSATGDWVAWEKPGVPGVRDCPHPDCVCVPTLFDQRRTNLEIAALRDAFYLALLAPPYDDDSDSMERRIEEARTKIRDGGRDAH